MERRVGKAPSETPSFQPYWGKPAVRNDRGDRGDVGIIRSPVRASILPDCGGRPVMGVPTAIPFVRDVDGFDFVAQPSTPREQVKVDRPEMKPGEVGPLFVSASRPVL